MNLCYLHYSISTQRQKSCSSITDHQMREIFIFIKTLILKSQVWIKGLTDAVARGVSIKFEKRSPMGFPNSFSMVLQTCQMVTASQLILCLKARSSVSRSVYEPTISHLPPKIQTNEHKIDLNRNLYLKLQIEQDRKGTLSFRGYISGA